VTHQPTATPGSASAPSAISRPAVLVVDDVEGNLVAVEALLADLECDIVLARSGNQALRIMLKR
jgi:CheY-like chemotaxis protein